MDNPRTRQEDINISEEMRLIGVRMIKDIRKQLQRELGEEDYKRYVHARIENHTCIGAYQSINKKVIYKVVQLKKLHDIIFKHKVGKGLTCKSTVMKDSNTKKRTLTTVAGGGRNGTRLYKLDDGREYATVIWCEDRFNYVLINFTCISIGSSNDANKIL